MSITKIVAAAALLLTLWIRACGAFQPISPQLILRQISRLPKVSAPLSSPHISPLQMVAELPSWMLEKIPSKSIVDAVEGLGETSVLPSDVAAAAGVSLSQARQELTTLAALSRADLAVSEDGDLIYKFPNNLSRVLSQNSAKYQALQTFRKVWPAAFWALRVSFGVALLASLAVVFASIVALQSSSSSDDDRRRDDRGPSFGSSMSWYWGPSPFDFFYYRPYGAYGYYGTQNVHRDPEEMGLFESIFSYVFGDGNPNAGLEEKRLALAADTIRASKGAVTAEQLAPFVDDAPSPETQETAIYVDESYVLPIVAALGGEPVVTEDGEIVYIFPELQTSASSAPKRSNLATAADREAMVLKRAGLGPKASAREIVRVLNYNGISTRGVVDKSDLIQMLEDALPPLTPSQEAEILDADPSVLQEQEWKFSLAPGFNKVLAGGLGALNLGGALYLGSLFGQYASYGYQLPLALATVQAFFPALLGYAVLFNLIPLVRNLWIKSQNEQITQRNKRRKSWRNALADALSPRLRKKLKAADKMKTKIKQIGASSNEIVFDTSKPSEDNSILKQQRELQDFDKLLGNDDKPFQ